MKTLLCYCSNMIEITEEDLGFDELECPRCGLTYQVPESLEELYEHNEYIRKEIEEAHYTGKIKIMAIQETGEVKCYRMLPENDEELINLVLAGYKLIYPECKFFTEREENMNYVASQLMLDERI